MEGFTFWRGYLNTLKIAAPEDVKTVLIAMGEYVLDDQEPELDGTAAIIFEAFRANLDKSKKRATAGKSGGEKANASKTKQTKSNASKRKQTEANEKNREAIKTNNKKQITNKEEQITKNVGGYGGMPYGTALEVFDEFAGGNEDLRNALRGFHEMRVKIKKPLTPRAAQMIVNALTGITTDPGEQAAVLDQSTVHGWQTVYPLHKDEQKKEKNGPTMEAVTPRPDNSWVDDVDPETGLPWANDG